MFCSVAKTRAHKHPCFGPTVFAVFKNSVKETILCVVFRYYMTRLYINCKNVWVLYLIYKF